MPHDLMEGFWALAALTYSGSLLTTEVGGYLPNQAPRSFFF